MEFTHRRSGTVQLVVLRTASSTLFLARIIACACCRRICQSGKRAYAWSSERTQICTLTGPVAILDLPRLNCGFASTLTASLLAGSFWCEVQTELCVRKVCVAFRFVDTQVCSRVVQATASVDLRTVSDRSPSRSSVKDGNGEEVQLPPNIASWCSVAEAEGNSAFHVLPMQTVADAPASASAVVSSDAAAAASAFMSRRMLNIQTDSASDSLAEYHDWKNGSETNAGSIATRPTGFLKCCLWLSTADADVRDAFSPGLPSRLKKPMAATPTKTRRGPANDRLQALRGNIDNFSLSVDTQPISDMRSYSLGSPTTQSYASAPSTMRGFALHGEDQGQLETQSQDSLSGVFPSARALLQWQINKIRDGGAWSLDDLERMLHNTDTNGAGTPRASSAQIAHSARASVSGHKRAESLTAGLLERSASVVEFEAQRQVCFSRGRSYHRELDFIWNIP